MKKLFWGWLLILLDFNLQTKSNGVVTHSLNVLPDFVGWLLVLSALGLLAAESGLFAPLRPFAMGMAVYTGVLWGAAVVGLDVSGNWILGTISTVVELYVAWALVVAIRDVEERRRADLNSGSLNRAWVLMLLAGLAGVLTTLLAHPLFAGLWLAAGLLVVVGLLALAAWIWFLVALWKCAAAYEDLPPLETGHEF